MEEQKIHIVFSSALVRKPITYNLIHLFPDLAVNILRAQVAPESGWMELSLAGDAQVILKAKEWLTEQGLTIKNMD